MSIEDRVKAVLDRELAACMAGMRGFPSVGEVLAIALVEQATAVI